MNYLFYLVLNILIYLIFLKLGFSLFKKKYWFPFRVADLFAFFSCSLVLLINYYYQIIDLELLIYLIVVNLNFLYIFFHLLNLVVTSPRTKIVLDIYSKKKVNKKKYFQKYNYTYMVNQRIKRLMSNDQIFVENNKFKIRKKYGFFSIISFVFLTIKKF